MVAPINNAPPKAEAERISNLLSRINNGEIKIPKFQRPFVWRHKAVLDLLESLVRGYPMGSLLFWRTEEKLKSERDIHGFSLPSTQEKYPTNYVLDGQQRLTTIYGVLSYRGNRYENHVLDVIYDLEKDKFRHAAKDDKPCCIPLNILFDFSKFNAFQRKIVDEPNGEELASKAERLNETFREYLLPVVTITDRTLDEVCPIFERINSTGTKLTVFDLMVAALYKDSFDLNDEVSKIIQTLKAKGFDLEADSVVRALAAVRGGSCKRTALLAFRDIDVGELRLNIEQARSALERSIDFLRTEVGVVSGDFLPYDAQLTILARIFSLKPTLTSEQRRLIQSWFWNSSFSERYRGASDSLIDDDIKECTARLLESKPLIPPHSFSPQDIQKREFRKGSAISNAFVALLATCHPLDLTNGARIDVEGSLSWSNQREFHHIFPRAYLSSAGTAQSKEVNSIVNIMLLSSASNKLISARKPSAYMSEFRAKNPEQFSAILASNLVPSLEESGLLNDDYEKFLQTRAAHIAALLNERVAQQ
jgi:hypothetical protein